MMEPDDFSQEPEQDEVLERLLAPLRQVEPSLHARVRNRMAIADALRRQREIEQKRSRPWWSRRVSIPVPIAAALLIAAGLALMMSYRGIWTTPSARMAAREQAADRGPFVPADRRGIAYHETETYLCGFGRLKSESGYFIQE
jgi:hypothetical protein